ncbi:unnamed protein product [Urochloa humidicola]
MADSFAPEEADDLHHRWLPERFLLTLPSSLTSRPRPASSGWRSSRRNSPASSVAGSRCARLLLHRHRRRQPSQRPSPPLATARRSAGWKGALWCPVLGPMPWIPSLGPSEEPPRAQE